MWKDDVIYGIHSLIIQKEVLFVSGQLSQLTPILFGMSDCSLQGLTAQGACFVTAQTSASRSGTGTGNGAGSGRQGTMDEVLVRPKKN